MFNIYDGRESFYQWDLNQKLIVLDESITEVHFCNKTDDCALVCEVYKEGNLSIVDVPNILLQNDWTIRAYGVNANHTEYERRFKVISRSKPADYVYTETECKTWEALEDRMDILESTLSVEGIANAVEEYLAANPVEAGATAEERAQIEANSKGITALQKEVDSKLDSSELPKAIDTALAEAKASGDFKGESGKDGVSATHKWSGTTLTITSASGTSSANLKGETGSKGADGKTPVKGVDYYTAADKTEMVNSVIAALPLYKGEVVAV